MAPPDPAVRASLWSAPASWCTARRSSGNSTCPASPAPRSNGPRASPSPAPAPNLASLQTRAVKDGDDYVINGQKIWTSNAHHSDWIHVLTRTNPDAPKHRGISYFLLDMKTPGIEVRPLINMLGDHEFNEVYFTDVRVPAGNMLGEENRGWYVAATLLDLRTFRRQLVRQRPSPDRRTGRLRQGRRRPHRRRPAHQRSRASARASPTSPSRPKRAASSPIASFGCRAKISSPTTKRA